MPKTIKLITGLLFFLFLSIVKVYALEIVVIVNSSGPLINATEANITDIYLGDKRFEDAVKIIPLLLPEGAIKETFLKEAVNMTPKDYKLYWTKKLFQEGIPIPKTVDHPADIVNIVRTNEGGIGFLPKEMLKDISGIKIIKAIRK